MVRSNFARVMRVGRATVFAIGLAMVLAVVLGVATTALAAVPGDPFKLGQVNAINALTGLTGSTPGGAMLLVDNNSAAAGSRALDLRVEPGRAPMTVNSGVKVDNLNAAALDGKSSVAFLPAKVYEREQDTFIGANTSGNYFPACDAGDIAISGGYKNLEVTSYVLRNEHYALDRKYWAFGIRNYAQTSDAITVEVVCIDYS